MKDLETLIKSVYALAGLFVLMFFSGFLDYTKYKFIPSAMYFLILIGGIALVVLTLQSNASTSLKGFLLIAGVSIALLGILANNEIFGFKEREDIEYLFALFYLIGTIGSLIMMWIKRS
jgi:predicted ferric reductase